jgi:hypothetical protein
LPFRSVSVSNIVRPFNADLYHLKLIGTNFNIGTFPG